MIAKSFQVNRVIRGTRQAPNLGNIVTVYLDNIDTRYLSNIVSLDHGNIAAVQLRRLRATTVPP